MTKESFHGVSFPMTAKNDIAGEYAVTVLAGDDITLQDFKSAVSVDIPKDVKGTFWQKVHTEFSRFKQVVPEDECFVGPVVELHLKPFPDEGSGQHQYRIKIPHCIQTAEEISSVMVRCGDTRKEQPFVDLPRKQNIEDLEPGFVVNSSHIVIYSHHLSDFICSCKKTSCDYIMAFPFGNLTVDEQLGRTTAKVKVYLCPSLYKIPDFKQVRKSLSILPFCLFCYCHIFLYSNHTTSSLSSLCMILILTFCDFIIRF